MDASVFDFGDRRFWLIVMGAIALLSVIRHARLRQYTLASVNAVFIWLLIGQLSIFVLVGIVVFRLTMHLPLKGRLATFGRPLAGVLLLWIFLVHKLSWFSNMDQFSGLRQILVGVGFSYLMLRVIDLWRCVAEATHRPPGFAETINYLLPFHMLLAGPIQSYSDFCAQPAVPPPLSVSDALAGVERIVQGLFKKYVIAYAVSEIFLTGFRSEGLYLFLEMQLFFLWLFLDFSAYSDIAVGIGQLAGVATPENFRRPYLARNVIDFWERWHVSLGDFIRRRIFVPLQVWLLRRNPNASPLLIASMAFGAAFILCGLWHDVSLKFLVWGGLHAVAMIACTLWRHLLRRWLGRDGMKRFMQNRVIHCASVFLTYEYVALTLLYVGSPEGVFAL